MISFHPHNSVIGYLCRKNYHQLFLMNKRRFVLLAILGLLLISTSSCNSKKGGSGEAYVLKMRLAKGDKFGQDLDMNMKMAFSVQGQKMDMSMGVNGATSFEVIDTTTGMKELALTYDKMNMTMQAKTPDGTTKNLLNNDVAGKVVGKTIKMRINDKNEITTIEGVEDIMWGDSTDSEAAREQMKKMFSKEQMNSLFGMMFQLYPDKPVRVGDTWEKETQVTVAGVDMKMAAEYELKEVKNGVAYISVDGTYKGKGRMNQGTVQAEMEMSGGQKGNINIGLADGYVKDAQLDMDIKADMKARGQSIPVSMKGYYIMKGR